MHEYNKGWIKLPRDLIQSHLWLESTPEQKTILITLLTMVNYKEKEWEFQGKKFTCQPGQVITSLESIAKKTGKGISVQNVRTAIKRFEKLGFLTNHSTSKNRLITICKWELYQSWETFSNQNINSQLTGESQPAHNQVATNKNINNLNNKKEHQQQTAVVDDDKFLINNFFQDLLEDADWRAIFLKERKSDDTYISDQDIDLLLFHFRDLSIKRTNTYENIAKAKAHFTNWFNVQKDKNNLLEVINSQKREQRRYERKIDDVIPKFNLITHKRYYQTFNNTNEVLEARVEMKKIIKEMNALFPFLLSEKYQEKIQIIIEELEPIIEDINRGEKAGQLDWFCKNRAAPPAKQ